MTVIPHPPLQGRPAVLDRDLGRWGNERQPQSGESQLGGWHGHRQPAESPRGGIKSGPRPPQAEKCWELPVVAGPRDEPEPVRQAAVRALWGLHVRQAPRHLRDGVQELLR